MIYKLKENVGIVYWMETKEYLIEDENGNELTIRVTENSKGSETIIETENGWEDVTDKGLKEYIWNELPFEIE